jgi:DnaJ-class molecular chaperone
LTLPSFTQAYEILSDAEKRKKYDLFGLVDDGEGGGGGGSDPFGDGFDPFTVFQQMFERQGGGNREKGLGFRCVRGKVEEIVRRVEGLRFRCLRGKVEEIERSTHDRPPFAPLSF